MAFYRLEPFGPREEAFRSAQIASSILNVNGADVNPTDFMPAEPTQKTPQEIRQEKFALLKQLHKELRES
jgi:hypothetical protein